MRTDVILAIVTMGATAYACRAGGFFLMRYVPLTPPVQAWLKAIPMAIVGAILGPVAVNGGVAEWIGLAAAVGLMWITGRDFIGLFGGLAAVALVRLLLGPG